MGKKEKLRAAAFCPELDQILRAELAQGNQLAQAPYKADWPHDGSVFASLVKDFKTKPANAPAHVEYSVCNDPHYGWYGECYCRLHQHLLVAGSPRIGKPSR